MGFLSDLFFGQSPKNKQPSVPKKVKEWEEDGWLDADKNPVNTKQDAEQRNADDTFTTSSVDDGEGREQPVEVVDPYRDASGRKILPEVEIDRCKSNLSSGKDHLDVWVFIKNNSEFDIEVTRINFLGRGAAGCFLGAGGSREIRIYSGDTPKNDAYKTAQVQYKITESGDYFQTNHYVEYSYEQDGDDEYYVPEEFKLDRVVKDI